MSLTHRTWLARALALTTTALSGCGGIQAGGQTGEESSGHCVYATSPLSAQERSPFGFSAAQVLQLAEGAQQAAFDWQQSPGIGYGPERGRGKLTLNVAASGSAKLARVVNSKGSAHCEDHVRIPVSVSLTTEGGAFDESFGSSLEATRADEVVLTEVVPSAELRGAFAFSEETLKARRFLRLEVNLRFRAEGFAGYLFGGLEAGDQASGTTSFQAAPLACWGELGESYPRCAD